MTRAVLSALLLFGAAACSDDLVAGGSGVDAGVEDDPLLSITPTFESGSLEELQVTIIQERCSGQPGLCHNSQFEPNLSTTANTYAYMVNRPAIENGGRLRVNPGDPDTSFLIDKIRNRNGVQTQMPLGAEPLTEDEMQLFEAWINAGSLRDPDADAPIKLNEPPLPPEIGAFDGATRIDGVGSFSVSAGTTVTFRHSVADFETADADIPFGILILSGSNGMNLVLEPGAPNPADVDTAATTFDAAAPMGAGDLLNFEFSVTMNATMDMVNDATNIITPGVDLVGGGVTFTPIVLYLDAVPDGIVSFAIGSSPMVVQ